MNTLLEEKIGQRILGTWRLVSWVFENEKGEEIKYFGKKPEGILMYDGFGNMSVQIAQENRPRFTNPGIDSGTQQEMMNAFSTFLAYYARYEETEPGVFEHSVENSLFPNWSREKEIRYAELHENTLILSTHPIPTQNGNIIFKLTWHRVTE